MMVTLEIDDFAVFAARAEPRTSAICVNDAGESRLVVAARGWVLVVDPATGECSQLVFSGPPEFPFACLASESGTMWTGAGTALYEVDPFSLTWRAHRPDFGDEQIVGMGFAEGPDGRIWFTTFPGCQLYVIDPATGRCEHRARLSETEQYAVHLAADDQGRLYVGLGTEQRDLVVLTERDGPCSVVPGGSQGKGSGFVHRGVDGRVYGHWDSDQLHPVPGTEHAWHRLDADGPTPIREDEVSPSATRGRGFGRVHAPRDPGWSVELLDLPERRLVVADGRGGRQEIALAYESAGADLSTFTETADGRVIGSSSHPLRFYQVNPAGGTAEELERGSLARAGGNVCAWTRLGDHHYGAAYAGGHLYRYDPAVPCSDSNPQHLVAFEQVHRPRCAVAHPDGRHVIWGGYGGYGDTGGGLAVHRVDGTPMGHNWVVEHTDLVPHHATTALGVLSNGEVIGATSVDTPGGARQRGVTGVVHRLTWPSLQVIADWEPDPHVQNWVGLVVAPDDTVHVVSADGRHLHLDPADGSVLARHDRTEHGRVARGGVVTQLGGDEGPRAAILQAGAVTVLDLTTHRAQVHRWPGDPITAGGVLRDDAVVVACGQRLVRATLPASNESDNNESDNNESDNNESDNNEGAR